MKNIVIVTPARCGSSWLLASFGEIGYNKKALLLSHLHHDTPLSDRITEFKNCQPCVTKVFTDGMIDLELLNDGNTEFIWLYRRNRVEHFLSNILCNMTNIHNIQKSNSYTQPHIIEITDEDLDLYENIVQCEERNYIKYKNYFSHEIEYEMLFSNNIWGFKDGPNKPIKLNYYNDTELIVAAQNKLNERGIKWQM